MHIFISTKRIPNILINSRMIPRLGNYWIRWSPRSSATLILLPKLSSTFTWCFLGSLLKIQISRLLFYRYEIDPSLARDLKNLYFCLTFKIFDQVTHWTWLEIPKDVKECHWKVSFPTLSSQHPNSLSWRRWSMLLFFCVCVFFSMCIFFQEYVNL